MAWAILSVRFACANLVHLRLKLRDSKHSSTQLMHRACRLLKISGGSATTCLKPEIPPAQECPMGLWVYGFGALALVLGWFLTPYLPDLCSQPDLGFIDVVSIDQEDKPPTPDELIL